MNNYFNEALFVFFFSYCRSQLIEYFWVAIFYLDNHPDPYGLGTASEESEEEEDCLMDMDKIMKLIKDNDGRILGTINKREIQRAKRVICIARKPEITNMVSCILCLLIFSIF